MADFVPWYIFGQEYRYEFETKRIQDFNQGECCWSVKSQERKTYTHISPKEERNTNQAPLNFNGQYI